MARHMNAHASPRIAAKHHCCHDVVRHAVDARDVPRWRLQSRGCGLNQRRRESPPHSPGPRPFPARSPANRCRAPQLRQKLKGLAKRLFEAGTVECSLVDPAASVCVPHGPMLTCTTWVLPENTLVTKKASDMKPISSHHTLAHGFMQFREKFVGDGLAPAELFLEYPCSVTGGGGFLFICSCVRSSHCKDRLASPNSLPTPPVFMLARDLPRVLRE